jgi:hypothetical protein
MTMNHETEVHNMAKAMTYSRAKIRQSGRSLSAKKSTDPVELRLERGYHALQAHSGKCDPFA